MNTRNYSREAFKERFSYSDITEKDILKLEYLIKEELLNFNNKGFTMKLCQLRKNNVSFDKNGNLIKCFFRVKGTIESKPKNIIHFTDREAISFNQRNGEGETFIGFAGWADDKNVIPFLKAFNTFINEHLNNNEST